MKKRILAAIMILALAMGLCGCQMLGKKDKVTAESLIDGIPDLEAGKHHSFDFMMKGDVATEEGSVSVDFSTGMEVSTSVVHLKGAKISAGMQGLSFEIGMEGWSDLDDGTTYTNMSFMGQESGWTKSRSEGSSDSGKINGMLDMDGKIDAELVDDGKGDYVVKGDMSASAINDLMGSFGDMEGFESIGDATSGTSIKSAKAEMAFGREDKMLKSVHIDVSFEQDGTPSTLSLDIKVNALNQAGALQVPSDVIADAVDDGDMGIWGDGDDGHGGDPGGSADPDPGYGIGSGGGVTGTYYTDNEGYDDVIDPMAQKLVDAGFDPGYISVYHYGGYASLNVSAYSENVSREVKIYHVDTSDWTAQERYEEQYEFFADYHPDMPAVYGTAADGEALFAGVEDGDGRAMFAQYSGDLYVEAYAYMWDSTDADSTAGILVDFVNTVTDALQA